MKKIFITFITFILLFSLVSCSAPNYSDALSPSEIYAAVSSSVSTENGTKVLDPDAILEISEAKIPYLKDFIMIRANDAKNVNEYGIFRAEDGKANEVRALIESYVKTKQASYLAMNYLPEETKKIENAKTKIFGNYVIYSFLNESDTDALYNAIKSAISK